MSELESSESSSDVSSRLESAAAEGVDQSSRDRFGSQDDLDAPHLEAVKTALSTFNASSLDDMAKKGLWTSDTVIDTGKFRNLLHQLVECYVVARETDSVPNLEQSFAECLSVLLEHGVDVNEGDMTRNTPLHLVCHHCGVDAVIRALVAAGAKVNLENANNQTPVHLAADNGSSADLEVLLGAGAEVNKFDCVGHGPLHYAVKYRRNNDAIKCLIACGGDIDLQCADKDDKRGSAPLHTAVKHGRVENVQLLLDLGAQPDVVDSSGQTPLHLAARYDITGEMIKYLLRSGADINYSDDIYGETPLHKAIKHNMVDNVKVLIQYGASLSQTDALGDSPLHTAALCCQNIEIWIALMNGHKPDIRQRNAKKQTVMERASRASNKLAVNILKQMEQ